LEIYKLEKNVSMLATISGAGPMTGFRDSGGNDSGFHKMATAGGQIEVGALSEGIYTAMTTVVGLVVGIIAYVGYNHLVVRQTKLFTWKPMQLTFRLIKRPHNYEFKRKK
jgi:biopolymer transport protein ExbB